MAACATYFLPSHAAQRFLLSPQQLSNCNGARVARQALQEKHCDNVTEYSLKT